MNPIDNSGDEPPRYTGGVHRASGWIRVETTHGRGRYDRDKQFDQPKMDVWLRKPAAPPVVD